MCAEFRSGDRECQDSGAQTRGVGQESAELHFKPPPKQPIGEQILAAATERSADLRGRPHHRCQEPARVAGQVMCYEARCRFLVFVCRSLIQISHMMCKRLSQLHTQLSLFFIPMIFLLRLSSKHGVLCLFKFYSKTVKIISTYSKTNQDYMNLRKVSKLLLKSVHMPHKHRRKNLNLRSALML